MGSTKINAYQQGRRNVIYRSIRQRESGRLSVFCSVSGVQVHGTTRDDGRNGVFINHLCDCVSQKDYILIKRLDLTLQFDAVDEVNRDRHMFSAQGIEKRVLQKLAFVAHDMLRVQKLCLSG